MTDIAHIIQLAVAPVFLLTGIAAFLGVLSNRLSRITDRARVLERRLATSKDDTKKILEKELSNLWKRNRIINRAIMLCTFSALMICLVIVMLFCSSIIAFNLSTLISIIFILSMLSLTTGLIGFLREVTKATKSMQRGMEVLVNDMEKE
jgi:uncharacterized membrane protein YGL010W